MSHNTVSGVSRYPKGLIVGSLAAALAMLCVMGCSSGAPTVYGQGVPVTPPVTTAPNFAQPGTIPAGRGGPMVGQPGYVGPMESAPRGTDRRVLPPTKEPGIWASDSKKNPKVAILMNLTIELPKDAEDAKAIKQCVALMGRSLYWSNQNPYVNALPENKQRCVAAMFLLTCASANRKREADQLVPPGTPTDKAADLAAKLVNTHCAGVKIEPADEEMMKAVYNEWSKKSGGTWWD